jgi:hypothetical protein
MNGNMPIPVAVRSKAWVFGRSLARIVCSNTTGGMDVCVVLYKDSSMKDKKRITQYKKWTKGENPRN